MKSVEELHHATLQVKEKTKHFWAGRKPPHNVAAEHAAERTRLNDRIASRTTALVGTMYAFYLFALLMAGWILWQGKVADKPFDPYPFAFLLFLGNIVQLLLMPLIMVGQNVQGRQAELRAIADYETNVKAEQEIETVLMHLEHQNDLMLEILKRLDAAMPSTARI